jgi:formylglycine-generating enzyme required for sulfatase activity
MDLIYIPPGSFIMGSQFDEPGRGEDEAPLRVNITKGYFLQTTEVTQQQWENVMGNNPANFNECGGDCPVENISWLDAKRFIDRLNRLEQTTAYRLPTEAEWEYAARAGNQGWFCFGNDQNIFNEYAWYKGNSDGRTQAVAQKKPNAWGLFDVHGNVWELCQDWDGTYPAGTATDPSGPSKGYYRVARGGAWYYPMLHARNANRFYVLEDDENYTVGFRIVMTP